MGLAGTGLVLQNNAGDDLAVPANGSFGFATKESSGAAFAVTIKTHPTGPNQNCTVANGTGSGTIASSAITSVAVTCRNVGRFAYVINVNSSSVSAFTIDASTGALTARPGSPYAAGTNPVWMTIDRSSHFVYVLNVRSNNLSAFIINTNTGDLITATGSPVTIASPVNSPLVFNPTSQFLYVVATGPNPIFGFASDVLTGALTPIPGSPWAAPAPSNGSGSFAMDPAGKFAVVSGTNSIAGFAIDQSTGALTPVSGSPFAATSPGILAVEPSGKVLLASVAFDALVAPSGVSSFLIDGSSGALTPVSGSPFASGRNPGYFSFNLSGSVAYEANTGLWNNGNGDPATSSVSSFAVNTSTGVLTNVAGSATATDNLPQNEVVVDPSGTYAYVANSGSNSISGYRIDPGTGALTPLPGSPFATG
jgi:6-phosphogluconolactonase (cycloisomerase 2 family)